VYGDIVDLGNNQFSMDVSYFNGPNLTVFTPAFVSVPIDVTGPVTLQSATAPNNSGWTGLIVNGSTARFSGGVNSNNWDSLSGSTNLLGTIVFSMANSGCVSLQSNGAWLLQFVPQVFRFPSNARTKCVAVGSVILARQETGLRAREVEVLDPSTFSVINVPIGGVVGEDFVLCNLPTDLKVSVVELGMPAFLKFNGNVRTSDITAITRHIQGTVTFPAGSYQYVAADVLTDFNIDVGDIIAVRSGILGIDSNIMTSAWRYPTAVWLAAVNSSTNLSTFEDSYNFSDVTSGSSLDFVAVKSGDVFNSTPNDPYDKTKKSNFLKFNEANIASAGLVELPVWVDNVSDLCVMSFALSTKNESLEIVGVKPGSIPVVENEDYIIDTESSLLKMLVVNIEDYTFSEKEPAFYLQLRTKKPNVRLSENMQIAEDEIDNEFYPKVVIAKSGQNPSNVAIEWLPETKVTESMQNSATLLSANPLQNDLIVRISLVEPTTITATLYDNTGRLMRQQSGRYLAGKSDINLVPDVSHLPSGAYHLELRTDASVLKAFKLIK
jgi:hypothetical protein